VKIRLLPKRAGVRDRTSVARRRHVDERITMAGRVGVGPANTGRGAGRVCGRKE